MPRKNIQRLGDHPLIAYSIAASLAANKVERVVVSTDDQEIGEISRAFGAEVPFLRPHHLAEDDTPDLPVFQHALEWFAEHEDYRPDIVLHVRPTSPLRPAGLLDRGIEILLAEPRADSARAVVPSGENPYKMWRPAGDGRIVPLLESEGVEVYNMPRQLLPRTFWQTGHLDVIRVQTILLKRSMTGTFVLPIAMDPDYAIDIDQPRDMERAERLLLEGRLPLISPVMPSKR
jgi:N-acylneuraminate cytidylyltransferase